MPTASVWLPIRQPSECTPSRLKPVLPSPAGHQTHRPLPPGTCIYFICNRSQHLFKATPCLLWASRDEMFQEKAERGVRKELLLTPLTRYAEVQALTKLVTPRCREAKLSGFISCFKFNHPKCRVPLVSCIRKRISQGMRNLGFGLHPAWGSHSPGPASCIVVKGTAHLRSNPLSAMWCVTWPVLASV